MYNDSPTAALLIIGNEILSGRTIDKNLPFLAKALNDVGVQLLEVRVVPDVEGEIVEAVNALRRKYSYLFTTGGIGPTHDDITAESISKAFNMPCEHNAKAVEALAAYYKTPDQLTEMRLRMARMPEGSVLIDNPVSGAPGFQIENVFVMAGVPSIMQGMFENLKDRLQRGESVISYAQSAYVAESKVAQRLGEIQNAFPQVDIGSYPQMRDGKLGTCLVVRGVDVVALAAAKQQVYDLLHDVSGGNVIEGELAT